MYYGWAIVMMKSFTLYLCAADICVLPFNVGVRLNNSSFAAAAAHGLPIVTTRGEMLESALH